ncbi:MAG: hypothetical protein KGJ92_08860 [Actinomycetales bacterium]|nr:hypothetical protein [Actinomycetales bacterium]
MADTSAVADPNTGVAVYDSYGEPGWMVFGGTSVASPIIASIYALAGKTSGVTAQSLYGAALTQVTSGTNAHHCNTYLCNAADSITYTVAGKTYYYNGPTGVGTPNGLTGF